MATFDFDSNRTCRSCLREGDNMYAIRAPIESTTMTNYSIKLEDIVIAEVIMACTQIKVMPDDGLPQIICAECVEQLRQAFIYKRMCEASDAKLRECLLRKNAIKIELQDNEIIAPECITVSYFNVNDPLDEYFSELKTDLCDTTLKDNNADDEDADDHFADGIDDVDEEIADKKESKKHNVEEDEDIQFARTAKRIGKRFQCQFCSKSLADRQTFLLHIRLHIGKKLKTCEICNRGFAKQNHLNRHMSTHSKCYRCKHCTSVFASEKLKNDHMRSIHSLDPKKTSTKPKELKSAPVEAREKRSATKPKGFFSNLLDGESDKNDESDKEEESGNDDETFMPDNVTDDDDVVMKDNIQPPRMQIRNEAVDSNDIGSDDEEETRLVENAKIVDDRFSCPFCVKTLADRQTFRLHIRLHTGHKLNRCTVCGRGFAKQNHLNKHMLVHKDVFPCHKCTEVFKNPEARAKHFSDIHPKSTVPQIKMEVQDVNVSNETNIETENSTTASSRKSCDGDNYDDDEDERLVNSAKRVNGRYECKFCTKTLINRTTLKLHIRLHIGKKLKRCSICDQGFAKQSHLNRHMLTHLKKDYPCAHCKEVFESFHERKVHESEMHKSQTKNDKSALQALKSFSAWSQPNGEKKCICMICDASFDRIASMRTHMRWHADTEKSFDGIDLNSKREMFKDFPKLSDISEEDLKSNQFLLFLQQQIKENSAMTSKMYRITNENGWELSLTDSETDCDNGDEHEPVEVIHKCAKCNEFFNRLYKLMAHMKRDHDINSFSNDFSEFLCTHCRQYYPNAFALAKHLRQQCENPNKKCLCTVCASRFMWQSSLDEHTKLVHLTTAGSKKLLGTPNQLRPKPFACEDCPKSFYRQDYLDRHRNDHLPREKRFTCDLCKKRFSRIYNLKSHMRVHIKCTEPDFADKHLCSYCGRSFTKSSNLVAHIRRHTGEKPFKCDLCDKGFPRSSDLKCHRRTHTGEKPCLCTICGRGFSRSNKLTRHMRIHTGDRPHKCTYCERAFTQSNDLTLHIRRHTGSKPYGCGICNERFITNSLLSQHRRTQGHFEETSNEPILPSNSVNHPNRLIKAAVKLAK